MVRHGQTEWNILQKYQGQTDIDLNDTGREQAKKLALYLAAHEQGVEAIYCSDLSRCRETALIIGKALELTPALDSRFREIHFGHWEGLNYTEVAERYPQELDDWLNRTLQVKISGGESISGLLDRSLEGIRQISAQHQGSVIIVSHGALIKILLNHLNAPVGQWKTYLHSGSMTILECQEDVITPIQIGLTID
jgi:broad specificity phosphatase PhoE